MVEWRGAERADRWLARPEVASIARRTAIGKTLATSQELSGSRDGDYQYLPWHNVSCQPNKSRNRSLIFRGVRTHADEDAGTIARGRAVVCR